MIDPYGHFPRSNVSVNATTRRGCDGPGLATTHGVRAHHDQLTNAALAASFRYPPIHRELKRKPQTRRGFLRNPMKESRDQGALDAPMLSQGTNQARRGSRKRP